MYFGRKHETPVKLTQKQIISNILTLEKESFDSYIEFYDRCIDLIKEKFEIEVLLDEHLELMDELAFEIMGYSKFFG